MKINFTKMNGAGNDFVAIDNRDRKIKLTPEQIILLCDRHRGIGADGLMMLVPSKSGQGDWAWDFYNCDGGEAKMCGNGSRCFGRYVERLTGSSQFSFETGAGLIRAKVACECVNVNLTEPKDLRLNEIVPLSIGQTVIHSFNTGVEHAVIYVEDLDKTAIQQVGSEIRYHKHFAPRGTNANFVQVLGPGSIRVRTYERGVEGETLACGTGVTASALVSACVHQFASPVKIQVQGGDQLEVSFDRDGNKFTNVHLTGPAQFVFEGTIEI